MSIVRVFAGLAAAVAMSSAARAAPLEAYGKLPSIEAVAISPTGNSLAYIATDGERRAIVVKDLTTNQFTFRSFAGTAKVRRVQWADDKHLLIASSVTAIAQNVIAPKSEYVAGFILDLEKRRLQQMMQGVGPSAMNVIVDFPVVRSVQGKPMVFVEGISFTGGSGRLSLFRVDVERASAKLALSGIQDVRDWVVGADGEPVAQELYDGRTGLWTLRVKEPGGWRDAVTITAPNDPPDLIGLGRDGRSVLYAMQEPDGGVTWREARLDGAPPGAPLRLAGALAPILDPGDGRVIGQYAMVGEEVRYSFFEENDNRLWNAVVAAFPGDRVTLASWSADHRKVVAYVDSPKDGPAYALVDLNTRQATWLGAQYGELKAPDIAERRPVRFKAADGLDLTGYLTLPRGRDPKNLPLVVFPHGGPASRDTPGFDWWAQAMASRGYAVLQVNFRGSDGRAASCWRPATASGAARCRATSRTASATWPPRA